MTDTDTEQTKRKRGRPVGTTKKTPEELAQSQREASSRWYYNNHEYRCAQKKKYYETNRERILEQRKKRRGSLLESEGVGVFILLLSKPISRYFFLISPSAFTFAFAFAFTFAFTFTFTTTPKWSSTMCSFILFSSSHCLCSCGWVNL